MKDFQKIIHEEANPPCDCGYVAWLTLGHLLKVLKAKEVLTADEMESIITGVIKTARSAALGAGPAYRIKAAIEVICETADVLYSEPPDVD